ncbi:hypothetical protein BD626DRAFT_505252 [Schizophyllum amplum]|uniref:Uncharacterized protein n=1 Tax=Schizophyllum amplum TaxID=97359 RepID=A0A550C6G5_9AGAR|nr:hypothetical protein BD626DRAFT_505252 [Auriculariopsis ampla]
MGLGWSANESSSDTTHSDALRWDSEGNYHPTRADINVVRNGLLHLGLPTELALVILDLAEYWTREVLCEREGILTVAASSCPRNSSSWCYIASPPLERRPRKIHFVIVSRDQGWGGPPDCRHTFRGSFSWTEVALMRPRRIALDKEQPTDVFPWVGHARSGNFVDVTARQDAADDIDLDDPDHELVNLQGSTHGVLQYNLVAMPQSRQYVVEWRDDDNDEPVWGNWSEETGAGYGGGFVRAIEVGDSIAVFARAKYPGWANHLLRVRIEIFTD